MDLLYYEKEYRKKGMKLICGVDEAGRGPLAGPVYAAAAILPENLIIEGVKDSKKLTPSKREYLYKKIIDNCLDYSIAFSTVKEIDEFNILNATHLAMKRAVESLKEFPDIVLVDGNTFPRWNFNSLSIVKGDLLSHSIACASILAKVSRDVFMVKQAEIYPEYGFQKHKGYGTLLHIENIKKYGPCSLHRNTFLKKILNND